MKRLNQGFTMVEVLIVLAIAGLVLLIVLLAVPVIMGSTRDHGRKREVNYIETQMEQYKSNNNKYPTTLNDACNFLTNFSGQNNTPTVDCTTGFSGTAHITAQANGYTIAFFNSDVPSDYIPQVDEIDVALSHWCNTDPVKFGENPAHRITNGNAPPFNNAFDKYVVWTSLERSQNGYCVDNIQ